MAISFLRIDDRIIHGQVVTRWAMERPCDGILVVNDAAHNSEMLKNALKSASPKKALIYSIETFLTKMDQAVSSEKNYFLITKDPDTLGKLILDFGFNPNIKTINVGPQSAREGTTHVNKNCEITKEEIEIYKRLNDKGYEIDFRLVPDSTSILFSQIKSKL